MDGSVYNLNVPLDVDPKMYFRCTDLLQGVFVFFVSFCFFYDSLSEKTKILLSLFAWDGAGGAVTSCLKLHEVFTKPSAHRIPLQSALSCFFFFLGTFLISSRPAYGHSYFDFIYYLKL